ncbi:hypothetical protein UA08_05756 [Talaromyces atroroseus]|uniref:Uncharacterized protein n=1 Tax=Talaromyces atroroseus TaxID=1441469 RepID=A0A225ATY7_TALAT|nr:hypothetical protein UA08_05756 [Talaromyces atroroseus]OKL59059.1 hypothetical protein UA08_05756 [Talaromyces atroroseus]
MDSTSKRVGNGGGLSILDQLKAIQEKVSSQIAILDQKIADQDQKIANYEEDLLFIRACELEQATEDFDQSARTVRNKIVHGRNVLMDIRALHFLHKTDPKRFQSASEGFFKLYDLRFEDEARIFAAPDVIKRTLNIRGNVKHLEFWKRSPNADGLIELCDGIIDKWQLSLKSGLVYPAETINQEYAKLREAYD